MEIGNPLDKTATAGDAYQVPGYQWLSKTVRTQNEIRATVFPVKVCLPAPARHVLLIAEQGAAQRSAGLYLARLRPRRAGGAS